MMVAGGSLALFPLAVAADQSLLLEPYLVCFCLLGVIALFSGGELGELACASSLRGSRSASQPASSSGGCLPSSQRSPAVLPRWRRGLRPLLAGLVVGFGVPCLVFVAAAPHAFFHDVVVAQLHRGTSGLDALSIAQRLVMISGLTGLPGVNGTTGLAVGLFVVFAVLVGAVYLWTWRQRTRFDWFVLVASVVVLLGMFSSAEFYDHYAYFPAAFLALLLGDLRSPGERLDSAAGDVRSVRHSAHPAQSCSTRWRRPGSSSSRCCWCNRTRLTPPRYLSDSADPSAAIEARIPEGACVVFDYAIFAIDANRFNPAGASCPAVVDPFGMWLTRNDGQPPPASPPFPLAFTADWRGWFDQSDYVVLSVPYSNYIPWTPTLAAHFGKNFLLVSSQPRTLHLHPYGSQPVACRTGTDPAGFQRLESRSAEQRHRRLPGCNCISIRQTRMRSSTSVSSTNVWVGWPRRRRPTTVPTFSILGSPRRFTTRRCSRDPTAPLAAIDLYRQILRIKPGDADSEFNLGLLLVHVGQKSQGKQLIHAAVVAEPSLAARIPAGITVP